MTPLLRHAPGDAAAVGQAGTVTRAELEAQAAGVAAALARLAPGPVVLVAEDRARFAAGLLGAWSAGRVVLLPPSTAPAALEALARGAAALLHDQERAPPDGVRVLDLRTVEPATGELAVAGEAAVVVHTSGSTGEPLAVRKRVGQLLGEAAALVEAFGLAQARVAATVPSHHIYGLLFGVLAPLSAGGAFLRETPLHAETVAAALARHGLDVLVSVPAHLRGLLALDPGALPPLRRVFSSGAPLPPTTARALPLAVTEVLGSTETGGVAWRVAPEEAWSPLPGVTLGVRDGQLSVDAPWLDPAAPRPHLLADRAELLADGRVRHLGRDDGVVKVAGKRVALLEVERALLALDGVRDAAVVALPGGEARGVELACAVVAPGRDAAWIKAGLAAWLDPVVVPRRVVLLEELPRAATGKLPRGALLRALGVQQGEEAG